MANIQWSSSTINSFFRTSLNQKSTGMNSLYGLLSDKSMIRSGSYHKLMDAYVKKTKDEATEENKAKAESYTYKNNGTKQKTSESVIDELI